MVVGRTRPIALGLSVLTLLLAVATAVLFTFDGVFGPDPISDAVWLLGVTCYAVVGGLIASRIPRNACGWLLLLIGLGLTLGVFTDVVSRLALRDDRVELASWVDWANAWLLFATVLPGLALYLLVFPTGRLPSRRWWPLAIVVIVLSIAGVFLSLVAPSGDPGIRNPTEVAGLADAAEAVLSAVLLLFIGAAIMAVVSGILRFRRAAEPERRQLRWLAVVGVLGAALLAVALGAGVLGFDRLGDPAGVAFLLLLVAGIPLSAAVALLKHRLYGIEVVANRSIVYACLVAVIAMIYAIVVGGVGAAVGARDRPNVFAAVAATVLAALVFQPVRRRAQVVADRIVYGDRASPYELVAQFTGRLDDATFGEILPRMATLVAEGTGAERVTIWLRVGAELRPVAGWPTDQALGPVTRLVDGELPGLEDHPFAVRHGGDLLGAISVAMPREEPMTPATERLLVDLSNQAGLVLRNVALVEELQRSRQRLVTSQDEARRRLERDLHDGAQQRLVTLSLDLRAALERAGASGDPELTGRLDAATRELARSLAELRELARGIHPAILTQNGLGAALRSLAERSSVPVEIRSVPEGRFSSDVEATAYFVVSEALANVAKHAQASRVWVTAADGDGRMAIEVSDDGVGGATLSSGGLRGLADRVEALGGRLDVRSEPGAGTSVLVVIPCALR